jgi:hypothetical protein
MEVSRGCASGGNGGATRTNACRLADVDGEIRFLSPLKVSSLIIAVPDALVRHDRPATRSEDGEGNGSVPLWLMSQGQLALCLP